MLHAVGAADQLHRTIAAADRLQICYRWIKSNALVGTHIAKQFEKKTRSTSDFNDVLVSQFEPLDQVRCGGHEELSVNGRMVKRGLESRFIRDFFRRETAVEYEAAAVAMAQGDFANGRLLSLLFGRPQHANIHRRT